MIFKHFKCKHCHQISTAGEWNSSTLEYANKLKAKMLQKIQHSGNSNRLAYICPVCNTLSNKAEITGVMQHAE